MLLVPLSPLCGFMPPLCGGMHIDIQVIVNLQRISLFHVSGMMTLSQNALQIRNVIVGLIVILVVNVITFWNFPVVLLPYIHMEPARFRVRIVPTCAFVKLDSINSKVVG
jgi:hypothetical protein